MQGWGKTMYEQLEFLHAPLDLDPVTGEPNYPSVRFFDNDVLLFRDTTTWQPDQRDLNLSIGKTNCPVKSRLKRKFPVGGNYCVQTERLRRPELCLALVTTHSRAAFYASSG